MSCFSCTDLTITSSRCEEFDLAMTRIVEKKGGVLVFDETGVPTPAEAYGYCDETRTLRALPAYLKANMGHIRSGMAPEVEQGLKALLAYPMPTATGEDRAIFRDVRERLTAIWRERLYQEAVQVQAAALDQRCTDIQQQLDARTKERAPRCSFARWPADDVLLTFVCADGPIDVPATPWSIFNTEAINWGDHTCGTVRLYNRYLRQELSEIHVTEAQLAGLLALADALGDSNCVMKIQATQPRPILLAAPSEPTDPMLHAKSIEELVDFVAQRRLKIAEAHWTGAATACLETVTENAWKILTHRIDVTQTPEISERAQVMDDLRVRALAASGLRHLHFPRIGHHWYYCRDEAELTVNGNETGFRVHTSFWPEGAETDLSAYPRLLVADFIAALYGIILLPTWELFALACKVGALDLAKQIYTSKLGTEDRSVPELVDQLELIPGDVEAEAHYRALAPHFQYLLGDPSDVSRISPEHVLRLSRRDDLRATEADVWQALRFFVHAKRLELSEALASIRWERCTAEWVNSTFIHGDDWTLLPMKEAREYEKRAVSKELLVRADEEPGGFFGHWDGSSCFEVQMSDGKSNWIDLCIEPGAALARLNIRSAERVWSTTFQPTPGPHHFATPWRRLLDPVVYKVFDIRIDCLPQKEGGNRYISGRIGYHYTKSNHDMSDHYEVLPGYGYL